MVKLFTAVVNMSITASLVILVVMAVRFCLKKAPKVFSYSLWLAVFVRLICPVILQADFGVVSNVSVARSWKISSEAEVGESEYGNRTNGALSYEAVEILAAVWFFTGCLLIIYEAVRYGIFMGKLRGESGTVIKTEGEARSFYIRISENIETPFLAGILRPVIYLPDRLSDVQRELVTEHEKMHIRRLDYLIKPAAFLICCIHWFNPLVWAAFSFMERDMEASCDEAVLRKVGFSRKKEYANTLLDLSSKEGRQPGYPIGFGENNVKSRIENAVNLKKTSSWRMAAAAVLAVSAIVILLINRKETAEGLSETSSGNVETLAEQQTGPAVYEEDIGGTPSFVIPYEEEDKPEGNFREEEYNYIESIPGSDFNDGNEGDDSIREKNRETITNYVPDRDIFENLLLKETEVYCDMEILYSCPVERK